jgi:mannose-6-phosphate isomerase-like protein (cupin superfamily)
MSRKLRSMLATVLIVMLAAVALAQDQHLPPGEGFDIKVLVDKEVTELPQGPLFWRIETFPTLEEAEAAAGPWGLAAEAAGEVWLFTLGPEGEETPGGTLVAEVGPLPEVVAPLYLLRINEGTAIVGGSTIVHTHPGAEAFYVLAGEVSVRTPEGVMTVEAGQAMAGHAPGTVMQVYNSGSTDLHELVMFVVDATQPFSSPAEFP